MNLREFEGYVTIHTLAGFDSYECEACGSLVMNIEIHNRWHSNHTRTARDANYAASLMTPIG